jgi:hypothetical protein
MIAYKYVKPARIADLTTGLIRFTQADALNDPFDVNPNLSEFIRGSIEFAKRKLSHIQPPPSDSVLEELGRKNALEFLKGLYPDYLMLSVSQNKNNILMWSHYAACHRGFAFGFDATHPFFQKKPGMSELLPVEYSESRFVLPPAEQWTPENTRPTFLRKSKDWEYEKEMRILAQSSFAQKEGMDDDNFPLYLFRFPKECLKEVIFGALTTEDDKTKASGILSCGYPHVQMYQARLHDMDFELEIIPI